MNYKKIKKLIKNFGVLLRQVLSDRTPLVAKEEKQSRRQTWQRRKEIGKGEKVGWKGDGQRRREYSKGRKDS